MRSAVLAFAAALMFTAGTADANQPEPEKAGPQSGQEATQPSLTTADPAKNEPATVTAGITQSMSLATSVATQLAQPPLPPPITLTLKVDLSAQRVSVIERGKVKYTWPVSSGREGYATQTGTFRPSWTAKMWYSRQWDNAPMPHAVFFNRGTAFHATNAVGALGRPASGGCIRLAPRNAETLFNLVHRHGLSSTKVVVQGIPRELAIAKREGRNIYETRKRQAKPRNGDSYQRYASGEDDRPRRSRRGGGGGSGWSF